MVPHPWRKKVSDDVLFWTIKLQLDIVIVHPKDTISVRALYVWNGSMLIPFFLDWTLRALILRLEFVLYLGEKGFEIISWIPSSTWILFRIYWCLRLAQFGISKKIYLRLFRRFFIFMVKASGWIHLVEWTEYRIHAADYRLRIYRVRLTGWNLQGKLWYSW